MKSLRIAESGTCVCLPMFIIHPHAPVEVLRERGPNPSTALASVKFSKLPGSVLSLNTVWIENAPISRCPQPCHLTKVLLCCATTSAQATFTYWQGFFVFKSSSSVFKNTSICSNFFFRYRAKQWIETEIVSWLIVSLVLTYSRSNVLLCYTVCMNTRAFSL